MLPPSKGYVNPRKCGKTRFKAIFSVCLGTLIEIWEHLGPKNKQIIFYISLEWPRVLKMHPKWGLGWIFTSGIQHKQLIKNSLLENESRYVILHSQALPKFYTHERSWSRGHGRKMYAHGDAFFFLLFFWWYFFLFFPENVFWHFMQSVSLRKMPKPIFLKKY